MGKQDRSQYVKYIEKISCGPGPAAYDSLASLKNVILRNKPKFGYFTEEGLNSSIIRKTIAAQIEQAEQQNRSIERLKSKEKARANLEDCSFLEVSDLRRQT